MCVLLENTISGMTGAKFAELFLRLIADSLCDERGADHLSNRHRDMRHIVHLICTGELHS